MARQPRDQHRKLLYEAEDELLNNIGPGRCFNSIKEAQNWVHTIQAVDVLLSRLPWVSVREAHGNAKASWAVFEDNAISLAADGMNEQVILHELAHLVTGNGIPYHGREFCWNYLDLTLRWRGPSIYIELRDAIRSRDII